MSSQANSGGAKTGTAGNRKHPPAPGGPSAATQPREAAENNLDAQSPTSEATAPRRRDAVVGGPKVGEDNPTARLRAEKPWDGQGGASAGVGLMQDPQEAGAARPGGAADSATAVHPAPKQAKSGKSGKSGGGKGEARAPRKAHLILRRIEPWSAMKFSFVVALVCFVVLFVAIAVLYGVLSGLGVFESITQTVNQLTQSDNAQGGFDVASWFEPVRILGYTALIGAVNVVLITALATLGAVIYNLSADLVGGIEVTFSEAE
jgi:Transmembrane domain of unknown function (DUF3566).